MNVNQINSEYENLEQCNKALAQQLHDFAVKLHDAAESGDEKAVALYEDLKNIAQCYKNEQRQTMVLLQSIHAGIQNHYGNNNKLPDYQDNGNASSSNHQNFAHSLHHSGFGQAIVRGIGFGIGDDLIRHIL